MPISVEQLRGNSVLLTGVTSGVYFLFNDSELVYIGEGWNCFLRVAEHTRKDSFKKFTSWNYIPVDGAKERKVLEKELRLKYKPKFSRI